MKISMGILAWNEESSIATTIESIRTAHWVATTRRWEGNRRWRRLWQKRRQQSKSNWRDEYTAQAVADYIREGFTPTGNHGAGAVPPG